MSGYIYYIDIPEEKWLELFANSGDPDQTPRSEASDLGLHCLPVTRLGVSCLLWVNKGALTVQIAKADHVIDWEWAKVVDRENN